MKATVQFQPGRLILQDDAIFGMGNETSARLFARRIMALPEVTQLSIDPELGKAWVSYQIAPTDRKPFLARMADSVCANGTDAQFAVVPHWPAGSAVTLVRDAEGIVSQSAVADPNAVPMVVSNTSVGLSAAGEIMLPLATPLAAGILVASNLNILRDAGNQLSKGKVGVPVFHTALLACSIVTGQVLAFALTDWSLRYWQRRWRKTLDTESRTLSEEALQPSAEVKLLSDEGNEIMRPMSRLQAGDRIRILTGESVPADGIVISGEALADERVLNGIRYPVRKTIHSRVLAGSILLAGSIEIEVERLGQVTQGAIISSTLLDSAAMIGRDTTLQNQAESMADRTVLPSLAMAGVGYMAGSLITVGAILHQDWISGPVLAVPLQTINHMRQALRSGAMVCNSSALKRIAECNFIVIDGDDPRLKTAGLALANIDSRLQDTDTLLRHIAGAALYLGDERSIALIEAARQRGLVVRQPELSGLYSGRVEARLGDHTLHLIDEADTHFKRCAAIRVVIDGKDAGYVSFREDHKPGAVDAIARIRETRRDVFLVSSAPEQETAALAAQLGIDQFGSKLNAEGRVRFLHGLQKRGVHPLYIGLINGQPDIAGAAHASVSVDDISSNTCADAVLLGGHYSNLADLIEVAGQYEKQINTAARKATVPNLLCIVGAFGGVLNGITSGIIANIGVMNVDRKLNQDLLASARKSPSQTLLSR